MSSRQALALTALCGFVAGLVALSAHTTFWKSPPTHRQTRADGTLTGGAGVHVPLAKRRPAAAGQQRRERRRRSLLTSDEQVGWGSSSSDRDHSIVLTDYYNNQYVGTVALGTPPQELTAVFDTGSSDAWIPGRGCTECGGHTTFDYLSSTTYSAKKARGGVDVEFEADYGSGEVTGFEGRESFWMGDIEVQDVSFGEVEYEDKDIQSFMMDGIVGLAFVGLSRITRPTILSLIQEQRPDLEVLFSMYLSTDPGDLENPSHLVFGDYNLSVVGDNATLHWTPVLKLDYGDFKYWTIKMNAMQVLLPGDDGVSASLEGDFLVDLCGGSTGCVAIVDSGTSTIAAPPHLYESLIEYVTRGLDCRGTTCYHVEASDFPVLLFGLAPDNVLPLRPEDYAACVGWGECVLKFQDTGEGNDFWILGDTFIEAYYTVFDVDYMRVGFACNGACSGGDWHGVGGYTEFMGDNPWQDLMMLVATTTLILTGVYVAAVYVPVMYRRVVSAVTGEEDMGTTSGEDATYSSVSSQADDEVDLALAKQKEYSFGRGGGGGGRGGGGRFEDGVAVATPPMAVAVPLPDDGGSAVLGGCAARSRGGRGGGTASPSRVPRGYQNVDDWDEEGGEMEETV